MTKKKHSPASKGLRILIDRKDFARALSLLVHDTNIDSFVNDYKRCEIYCIEPRDAYEKAKKVLRDNEINFFVEE